MKLKKYNQYIKEDIQSVDNTENKSNRPVGRRFGSPSPDFSKPKGIFADENEIGEVGQDDEFMDYDGDDASTLIGNNMNDDDQEEEEGNDASAWRGDQLLQQFAEIMGVEVADNQVSINGDVVTFAPETETFLINRKNTKVSDPHELVHKGFKGRDHKH